MPVSNPPQHSSTKVASPRKSASVAAHKDFHEESNGKAGATASNSSKMALAPVAVTGAMLVGHQTELGDRNPGTSVSFVTVSS